VVWLLQEIFFLLVLLGNNDAGMTRITANIRGKSKIILFKTDSHLHSFSTAVRNSHIDDVVSFIATETFRKI
jgi:hypothetical protein